MLHGGSYGRVGTLCCCEMKACSRRQHALVSHTPRFGQVLDLAHNSLASSLPESWGRLAFLSSLSLRNNSLEGTLPASWSSQTRLLQL